MYIVIAAHMHSQPQRSHQCVAGLLRKSKILMGEISCGVSPIEPVHFRAAAKSTTAWRFRSKWFGPAYEGLGLMMI
ncbi:hypothetical protein EVAR_2335_1 [Eumeta japonica]|uniref:Uncharacterized protein n=1 Tax=Eumeta variegata TaxID=151549 RepID=A0A4C1SG60_EUMVA|nr:hypothetical protein EVAR_2335_1 [Eumeta japonica]